MSSAHKRLRQTNLFESFSCSKRSKSEQNSSMEDFSQMQHKLAAAAAEIRRVKEEEEEDISSTVVQDECKNEESCVAKNGSQDTNTSLSYPGSPELFTHEDDVDEQFTIDTVPSTEEILETDSGELFSNNECDDVPSSSNGNCYEEEQAEMSILNTSPSCSLPLPKLEPLENHSIMFSPHIMDGKAPRPFPRNYQDKWDSDYVRMPCSPQNRYPVQDMNGVKQIQSRWDLICQSLSSRIESSHELEAAIMKYNGQYYRRWNFNGLHTHINQTLTEAEKEDFFEILLPAMIKMALALPSICTQPIPLLKKNKDHSVTLSQKQIACLLLNAFFCTFPRRNLPGRNQKSRWNMEYASYPDINFHRLFEGKRNRNVEKLKCIFNYFRRVTLKEPSGTVTFHRQYLQTTPRWNNSTHGIRTALVRSTGFIETEGHGMLQVDFANKYVGGGVLGYGCVQEEIRFIVCTELIASRLFVERLEPTEVLVISGVEQYNAYSGYADSFKWEGDFQDVTPRDEWGRKFTQLVAMDATHFFKAAEQYQPSCIKRELNKAFCAFYEDAPPEYLTAVATGNWGCGVYNGNSRLKFLIQLMAASQARRNMLYFTFGDKNLKQELKDIYELLEQQNLSVGDLWRILISYCREVQVMRKVVQPTLYEFLLSLFSMETESHKEEEIKITSSDQKAMEKMFENIHDDSSTDIEPT